MRGLGSRNAVAETPRRYANQLRARQTVVELKLWWRLRDRQLSNAKFRRQHPIGPFITDFCCPQARLIIELDGGQHAAHREADAKRTTFLEAQGYRVLRFWDHEVLTNVDGVLQRIVEALKHPHPGPLPKRERESDGPSPRKGEGGVRGGARRG